MMNLILSKLYHAQHLEYQDDSPFWIILANGQGGPVLELGCGTGRITSPLLEKGFEVTGVDNDPEMLEFIQSGLRNEVRLNLINADFIEFTNFADYNLVILPCNTYSTLNHLQRKKLLSNLRENLPDGGVFCTSVINPELLKDIPDSDEAEVEMEIKHPDTGSPLVISAEWKSDSNKFYLTWHYDHLMQNGQVERFSQSTEHYKVSTDALISEFVEAGFEIEMIGDFNGEIFNKDSQYLIIKAKK